jgi:OFA family oxalate/formate antiporter-like MFS transporter
LRQPVNAQGGDAKRHSGRQPSRWVQLAIGVICMGLVANLQYAWTLFVEPMNAAHHWGLASIQTAFSIFIVTETWLVPIEGYLVDRFGPRPVVIGGGICAGLGWILDAYAPNLGVCTAPASAMRSSGFRTGAVSLPA